MLNTAFFTICAKNYLPYALTLFQSFSNSYPDHRFYIVLADRLDDLDISLDPNIELVEAQALPIDDLPGMAFRYDITEFSTAIKPAAFLYLFDQPGHEAVVYLDPDTYVISPLAEVHELLEQGAAGVLTPHICQPVEDGEKPDDLSMLNAGIYNLGFLALRKCSDTVRVMQWWHRKLTRDCRIDLEQGLFVDQKWMDLLPAFLEHTAILRHPGYNVAYWNLMHRTIEKRDGCWLSNREPLRFFHFSGIDIKNQRVFSKHQTRFNMRNIGELRELAQEYRQRVVSNGVKEYSGLPYAFGEAEAGEHIPTIVRRMFRERIEHSGAQQGDPYRSAITYCNALEEGVPQDSGKPITRLMYRIWQDRPDLQQAFDLATLEGRDGYINWYLCSATRELQLGEALVESVRAAAGARAQVNHHVAGRQPAVGRMAPVKRALSWAAVTAMSQAPRIRSVYRHVSPSTRQRIRVALLKLVAVHGSDTQSPGEVAGQAASQIRPVTPGDDATDAREPLQALRPGALLVGYPKAELGMGEHVRLTADSFSADAIPFGIYNFDHNVAARQADERYSRLITDAPEFKANIFHINADQMSVAREVLGERFFRGRYNIGYWAWELSIFPDDWLPATELVNEIWAPSRFIQQALSEKTRCPVVWMPLAVRAPVVEAGVSRDFGIAPDCYAFLFYFDFASFATRKNPMGPIEAFRRAFPDGRDKVQLIIKAMAHDVHAPEVTRLRRSVEDDPRIVVINEVLSHSEMALLLERCDCFVSLHRSEGFGRGMAEAMAMGKPVIATNYSGNTDFMNTENSLLVDYTLVPVGKGEYVHWEGQMWAEPDIEQAAWYMRRVVDDPASVRGVGLAASKYIREFHSPRAIGARYASRLKRLALL